MRLRLVGLGVEVDFKLISEKSNGGGGGGGGGEHMDLIRKSIPTVVASKAKL